MTTQDNLVLGGWALSILIGLIGVIASGIGKRKEAFKFWAGFTGVSITPFGAVIPLIVVFMGTMCLIMGGGEKLIDRATKDWKS